MFFVVLFYKTTSILSALAIAAALTAGFTACTSDDNIISEPVIEQPAVKTYTVTIPATMPIDSQTRAVSFDGTTSTSTFAETERVYVYNVTTDEVLGGYLQPSDISADGKKCNLTGTLTGGTISNGDNLKLMYNLSYVSTNKTNDYYKTNTYFDYNGQDGTQSGVLDGAEADVTVSSYTGGALTTTATASFRNVQSMFRFKFEDGSSNAINVKVLQITTSSFGIRSFYFPIRTGAPFGQSGIMLNLPTGDSTNGYTWTYTVTTNN